MKELHLLSFNSPPISLSLNICVSVFSQHIQNAV